MKKLELLKKKYLKAKADIVDYEKLNCYNLTYHSTAIEGNTLTKTDTHILLDNGLTPKGKKVEEIKMTLDHFKALNYTLSLAKERKPLLHTELQKIAGLVVKNTKGIVRSLLGDFDPSKGEFRKVQVRVGSTSFPHSSKVASMTQDWCNSINERISKVKSYKEICLLAYKAHYQLVNIHPFVDGNGRTSRLLQNYIQHYFNEPIAPVLIENRTHYIQALVQSRKESSLEPFITFMNQNQTNYFETEITFLKKNFKIKKDPNTGISPIF